MDVQPVDTIIFRYSSPLKTMYKRGKLPSVKYDFYGEVLTPKNCTLEHLKCRCYGGRTELKNLVLSTANKNQERGIRPLGEVLNWEHAGRYFEQFKDIKLNNFDGNKYIEMVLNTIKELLNDNLV